MLMTNPKTIIWKVMKRQRGFLYNAQLATRKEYQKSRPQLSASTVASVDGPTF